MNRRAFLTQTGLGIGAIAAADLLRQDLHAANQPRKLAQHISPRAKRVIFLFQSGGRRT